MREQPSPIEQFHEFEKELSDPDKPVEDVELAQAMASASNERRTDSAKLERRAKQASTRLDPGEVLAAALSNPPGEALSQKQILEDGARIEGLYAQSEEYEAAIRYFSDKLPLGDLVTLATQLKTELQPLQNEMIAKEKALVDKYGSFKKAPAAEYDDWMKTTKRYGELKRSVNVIEGKIKERK